MSLRDTPALVTGAARGLGRCIALELLRAGARVAAGDIDHRGLRSLRGEAGELADGLFVAPLDVTVEASVQEFVRAADEQHGTPRVLVNNAGILRDGLLVEVEGGAPRTFPTPQWEQVLRTNLTGGFLMAREVVARMIAAGGGGVLINVSSLARGGNAGQSPYAASKAGLDACTRTWALELARHRIRVGGVAPGVIDTPILENISEQAMRDLTAGIPLGRLGRPEEVWQAVRFVIECEFFTGRTLEVDGGASLG